MNTISRRKTLQIIGSAVLASFVPFKTIGRTLSVACTKCEEVWRSLSKFNATRYQFRYIEPKADLPKVFIYGDSISIGYTEYVRTSLEGKACVYRLQENGGSSNDFIPRMETLRKAMFQPDLPDGWDFEWDVIHFNVGLHDLKYLDNKKLNKETGEQVSSLERYENNLEEIIKYLKTTYPKAKLICATTTPVPEGEPGRFAGDEKRYNKVLERVLKRHKDITMNDLCSFSIPLLEKYAAGPGNVHYKPEGSRFQGIEVAKIIAETLGIKSVDCPSTELVLKRFKQFENKDYTIIE
jgi:hypothetical protein